MAQKCVHKGCGKSFSDPSEPCTYHPGPPEFHEGQKGWKCCKPRVLTFDEFLSIPPCTTGVHSIVDDTPAPPKADKSAIQQAPSTPTTLPLPPKPQPIPNTPSTAAIPPLDPSSNTTETREPELSDTDPEDDSIPLPPDAQCKRNSCTATPTTQSARVSKGQCCHHPGSAIFHEGSKGWSCCKRRVLEFDEFMRIPGCKTKDRHLFVGRKGASKGSTATNGLDTPTKGSKGAADEDLLKDADVRTDFYQTAAQVHVSFFLKKIDASRSKVEFRTESLVLDLVTGDQPRRKRLKTVVELNGPIEPEKSSFRVLGTKLEVSLQKAASEGGRGWPVLRKGEVGGGGIYQVGGAGRM